MGDAPRFEVSCWPGQRSGQQPDHWLRFWGMVLIGGGLFLLGVLAALWPPDWGIRSGSLALAIPVPEDSAAPDLRLKDLQGKTVSLNDYSRQVVLVNNWATWCPPCRDEMPTLQAYFETHRQEKFTVVGIEAGEPAAVVADFVKQNRLTFPIWLDPGESAVAAFRNPHLPSSYVIDRAGRVRLSWNGAISRTALETYVTPLLKE